MSTIFEECAGHPDVPLVTRCVGCDRGLCGECWGVEVDERPACEACVPLLTRPIPALVPGIISVLGLLVLVRIGWLVPPSHWLTWAAYGLGELLIVISAWRLTSIANQRRRARTVQPRPLDAPRDLTRHPYRGAWRRSARRLSPPVSGTVAGLVVSSALVITAASVPALFKLPLWLELELVLAGWWLVWLVTLSVLLYRGWRVAKDPS